MEKTSIKALLKRREKQAGGTDKPEKESKKKNRLELIIVMLALAAVVIVVALQRRQATRITAARAGAVNTTTVETKDTVSEPPSSGALSVKDSYNIAALVGEEVTSTDFEEGDQVGKGQVLYGIDRTSMESQLSNVKNSLKRSQKDYGKTAQEYNEALSDCSDNTYKAIETGYISELNVSAGSRVSNNTIVARLCSDDVMKMRIPFLSEETALIAPGMGATLTLVNAGGQMMGTVTAVANQEMALTEGCMVRNIAIRTVNPGGLTISTRATAQIGEFVGDEDSTFMATIDTTMNAELLATVEVVSLLVDEEGYATVGIPVFLTIAKAAEDPTETYSNAMESAGEKMESAQSSLDNTQGVYDDYTITAPISDQVVTKSYKVGDSISRNTSSTATVVTICDPSGLTFETSTDELDILSIKVGQKVVVTADAPEGETYMGTVTNVSLEGTYSSGVTTYPVIVTMDEIGDLLPGMSVDGVITLDGATGALTVPSDALMRGDQVYVKDDTVTQQAGLAPVRFQTVETETGLASDSYVEVKSGLSEGDVIYVAETNTSNVSVFMTDMRGGLGGGGSQSNRGGQGGLGDGGG